MRLALSFLILLSLALGPLRLVGAVQTFAGCQSATYISQNLVSSLLTTLAASSNSACRTVCAGNGALYSYFNPGSVLLGLGAGCYCGTSTMPISAGYLTAATDSVGDCSSSDYTASLLNTTWSFGGCDSKWTDLGLTSSGVYATIDACLASCSAVGTAFVTPAAAGTWSCKCDSKGFSSPTAATCKQGVGMLYTQSLTTSTAGLTRRDALKLEERMAKRKVFCPKGLTACKVDADGDAYECIDPSTELESCGGCAHGEYGADGDIRLPGVDCSALPGTPLGAATCTLGRCVATSCRAGYTLSDGACARNRTAAARRRPEDRLLTVQIAGLSRQ